tara:strand:- start:2 stop:169 length:168 start_codon:yes stop_codon:yes gene_type:complete
MVVLKGQAEKKALKKNMKDETYRKNAHQQAKKAKARLKKMPTYVGTGGINKQQIK